MSDTGKWVQEGIAKLRDTIKDGETVEITHFVLSGSSNLGSLADFTVADDMTMGTFPHQVFTGTVSYSFINDDGFLEVHAEVKADEKTEFYCNGIGLIFEDVMGQKFLMAIGTVPVQQHAKTVNNTFDFVLPIVSDIKDIIQVTMEPGNRVSQAQLSAALKAHGEDDNAHEGYRNFIDPMLMFLADSVGLAHREHEKTLRQRFQSGTLTIFNQGVISGCEITPSQTATRNISMSHGKGFGGGMIFPVAQQDNGAAVPSNNSEIDAICYIYLDDAGDLTCTALDGVMPYNCVLLYKITVPAGNTAVNDPHLSTCTLSDLRRVEPEYPLIMTSPPIVYVQLPYDMTDGDYLIDLNVKSYSGGSLTQEEILIDSQASNGFSVCCTGIADNVAVNWTARKLNL